MKRLNVDLADELHMRLKVLCTLEGKDMSEVVRKLIEEYVQREEKRKLIVFPKSKS